MNIESNRQAWIANGEKTVQRIDLSSTQLIRRTRLRILLAIIIATLALVALGFGTPLILAGGFDVFEILAWSLIAATLVTLIGLVIRAHGIRSTRHLRVLNHVEAALGHATRLEALIRNLHWFFWAPMLIAFLMLAYSSEYRHWTDYTFVATSIGVLIWGLIYGRECVQTRMEADRKALQEQASRLRRIECEEDASTPRKLAFNSAKFR